MNMSETKSSFADCRLTKQEFVDAMHGSHLILNDYAEYIQNTEIKSIHIEDGKVVMTCDEGVAMLCNFADKAGVPLVNLSFGEYEKEERECMMGLISDGVGEAPVILDIGANYGWYSLCIAKRFPDAKIYAFEPIKYTYAALIENIKLNKADNIRVFNFGIGKENATAVFNYNKDVTGATSMVNLLDRDDAEKIECRIKTIDSFVEEEKLDTVDFIKCDIEGAEFFALQGAENVLRKYRPKLFVEMLRKWSAKFNYHPNDIINFMAGLGYLCFEADCGELRRIETVTDDTAATNFFFLHREKHARAVDDLTEAGK